MDFKNLKMTRAIEDRVVRLFNTAEVANSVIELTTAKGDFGKAADIAAKMRQATVKLSVAVKLLDTRKNRRAAIIQANKVLNERYVSKLEKEVLSARF